MRYIKTEDGKIYDTSKCLSEDFPFDPDYGITYEFEDGAKVNEHDIVAQADTIEELCETKAPMTGSEALENIKGIELMHVEHEEDEGIDGEWVYEDNEVYDGTVAENYPDEIDILEKEHKALEIIENKGVLVNELRQSANVDDYNMTAKYYDINYCKLGLLTQDEFDLLKEILK